MYYCNNCDLEIDDENIQYNFETDNDICPECKSKDVDYFKDEGDN